MADRIPVVIRDNVMVRVRWLVWVGLMILLIVIRVNHEPWRDEIDTWVVARDANWSEFLAYFASSGHPPLWYLLNLALVRLGLPLEAQGVLPICSALGMAWLLLFRSPF